ncbi:MutS-related protein [Pseudobacter ginsenosidimutans]|uniref:MutS-like protein n=1 Tax=Pseudobacter ginsenosidimutans TaxID=661488 RepID=A0A4Q7MV00_9BACT|nr:DNA mismatch repair protein [Pseudobacter ginsenosidimutans]QEC42234.1 DNA mismatch repair protein [Pseudobacter ginsenosidimutans]RZS70923.1 MutS-like protein [Pseudobacter ginsenosidimutans]
MHFIIDSQTLEDLKIFGKKGQDSVYALFNRTVTSGGAEQLQHMFRFPLSDASVISRRAAVIRFFQQYQLALVAKHSEYESAILYLNMRDQRSKLNHDEQFLSRMIRSVMRSDIEFRTIKKGILSLIQLMRSLKDFLKKIEPLLTENTAFREEHEAMNRLLSTPEWQVFFEKKSLTPCYSSLVFFDQLLRFRFYDEVRQLLSLISSMDVYISVAAVADAAGLVFPTALPQENNLLQLAEVWHPHLRKPVANSVVFSADQQLVFLTGANMAGKSTFMKSVGIAVYLAHMGFPVPAKEMRFSVMDGMLTIINLPDNLNSGYSHFYTEVLRVKKVAIQLQQGKRMMVLIDELFRGTNVKDALEATVAVTGKFAKYRNSAFIVSSHIMEAAELLRQHFTQINFQFLPTLMEGNLPVYPRKLETGISADRHGMIIIQNEGILSMLNQSLNEPIHT